MAATDNSCFAAEVIFCNLPAIEGNWTDVGLSTIKLSALFP